LVLAALSGPLASLAQAEVQGIKAAASVVNAAGGILGQHVVLTIDNDSGDPTTALNDVQAAVNSGTLPSLVVAGTDGSETDAVTPILTEHKIIDISPTAAVRSSNPSFAPYHFSSLFASAAANTDIIDELASSGIKNVGILVANDALGAQSLAQYVAALKSKGMSYESTAYPSGGTDFTPELLKLKAGNPQALIISALGSDAATAATSRAKIGWDILTYGDAAFSGSDVAGLVPPADTKDIRIFVQTSELYAPPAKQTPGFKKFYGAVRSEVGAPLVFTDNVYSDGYDTIMLAAAGAKDAGSVAGPSVAKALLDLKPTTDPLYAGFSYEHFDPSDHSLVLDRGDYAFIPLSKSVGGLFDVPAGVTP
jgi:branched-chain amino acid transport system substrate-binding protein